MNKFSVNISSLNKRITIEKLCGNKTTENGFKVPNWQKYKTVWASVNNLFGKEFYSAKAVNAENTTEFLMRFSKDLKEINSKDFRLVFSGRTFNITFVDNINYENRWLKIKAVEVI